MPKDKGPLLSGQTKKIIEQTFSQLIDPVTVIVFTDDGENKLFSEYSVKLIKELSEISDKILPVFEKIGGDLSKKYNITRPPTLLIQPEKYNIRLIGAPAGEEARTLMTALLMASIGKSALSDEAQKRLADLKEPRNVKIFVSPTCPYCPRQAAYAISAAIEKPGLVAAEIIEIFENKDLATQYGASSVPQTFVDDQLVGPGLQPEEVFIEEVVTAAPVITKAAYDSLEKTERELIIIGAGPAGLTAAMYAARSGISSIVIEKANIGGQVAITPVVENYPGFSKIGGKTLMDMMAQQAIIYADIREGEEVLDVMKSDALFEVVTNRTKYTAKSLLITTGAEPRRLGVQGEREFNGRGVSYCASCDGYFYKDNKKVIVTGGGNTAATDALYLKNLGADVTLVSRKADLKAEAFLKESLSNNKIPIIRNSVIKEIKGERLVSGVMIENLEDKTSKTLPADGIFIAIGYVPNNALAEKLGVEKDGDGYIKVDAQMRTSVKGIYAAGDITGGVKQIVTAVSQGAIAAMTIFDEMAKTS